MFELGSNKERPSLGEQDGSSVKRKIVHLTSVGHICCLLFGLSPVSPLPLISLQIQSLRLENNTKPCPCPGLPLPHSELPELGPHSGGHPTCGCRPLPLTCSSQGTPDLLHAKSKGPCPVTSYGVFLQMWTFATSSFSNALLSWLLLVTAFLGFPNVSASPQPPLHWSLFFYSLVKLEFSRPLLWPILFSLRTSELTSLTGQCIRTFMSEPLRVQVLIVLIGCCKWNSQGNE